MNTCTRLAPHVCRVNGPCNRWPKAEEAPQPDLELLAKQLICKHPTCRGGNDYTECCDCGLEWDYGKRTPLLMLRARNIRWVADSVVQGETPEVSSVGITMANGKELESFNCGICGPSDKACKHWHLNFKPEPETSAALETLLRWIVEDTRERAKGRSLEMSDIESLLAHAEEACKSVFGCSLSSFRDGEQGEPMTKVSQGKGECMTNSNWPIGKPNSLTTREQVANLGMRLKARASACNDINAAAYWHALAEESIRYVFEILKWSPVASPTRPEQRQIANEVMNFLQSIDWSASSHRWKMDQLTDIIAGPLSPKHDKGGL